MQADELVKARLWCLDNTSWDVEFQFNPSELSLSRNIKTDEDENFFGPFGGKPTFDNGEPDGLKFTVLVDTSVGGDIDLADASAFQALMLSALNALLGTDNSNADSVLPLVQEFYRLTLPIKPSGADAANPAYRPPVVAFVWEEFEFMGFITGCDVDFLLFDAEGRPKRAQLDVTMVGRAFSGALDLEGFLAASYNPPTASGSGARSGESGRDDLADFT